MDIGTKTVTHKNTGTGKQIETRTGLDIGTKTGTNGITGTGLDAKTAIYSYYRVLDMHKRHKAVFYHLKYILPKRYLPSNDLKTGYNQNRQLFRPSTVNPRILVQFYIVTIL